MPDDESRQDPSEEQITVALERTGFLFEQRVAKLLRDHNFETEINHAYPDPQTGQSREVDILAHLFTDASHHALNALLHLTLVIECKNNVDPFVLIGEHQDSWSSELARLSFDPLRLRFPGGGGKEHLETNLSLRQPTSPKQEFIGNQLLRMDRQAGKWRAGNNSIYDSILYPLAKAKDHEWQLIRNTDTEAGLAAWQVPCLTYLFPIIVTAGSVYIADAISAEAKVSRAKWAKLKRSFRTRDNPSNLVADIVSFEHLSEYLLEGPLRVLADGEAFLATNAHLYDPEWLVTNLGEPEDLQTFNLWREYIQQKN